MIEDFLQDGIVQKHMFLIESRKNPKNLPLHKHDHLGVFYICEGSALYNYKGKLTPVTKGDYFIIDCNTEHRMIYDNCECDNFECVVCTFMPEFIDSSLLGSTGINDIFKNYAINLLPYSPNGFYAFHDEGTEIKRLLSQMLDEYQSKRDGYLSFLRTYLILLILFSIRKVDIVTANYDERILEIVEYVNVHYNEQITLEMLCQKFFCTLSNISILFQTHVGITYTEYLRRTRINASCRLLANTQKTINIIANDVGYADVKTFRKHFKAHTGITPTMFRQKYKLYKNV